MSLVTLDCEIWRSKRVMKLWQFRLKNLRIRISETSTKISSRALSVATKTSVETIGEYSQGWGENTNVAYIYNEQCIWMASISQYPCWSNQANYKTGTRVIGQERGSQKRILPKARNTTTICAVMRSCQSQFSIACAIQLKQKALSEAK